MLTSLSIQPIPAFADNYLWLLHDGANAAIVDPGDAVPVRAELKRLGLALVAIVITHHHADHVGGVLELAAEHPAAIVYGPRAEGHRIAGITHPLGDGDAIDLLGARFEVFEVPGHTLGHISYWSEQRALLFCGDTLFSAGCGRLFEGTPAQMHRSLSRLAALPAATAVHCTHEYTLSNLAFAEAVEPGNAELVAHHARVRELRRQGRPSLPSSIGLERAINPFLRAQVPAVRAAAQAHAGGPLAGDTEVFAALRAWKDGFKPPASP